MYYFCLILLIIGALLEFNYHKTNKWIFGLAVLVVFGMLCLRYGQGTDYFSYYEHFRAIDRYLDNGGDFWGLVLRNVIDVHGETGWIFVLAVCSRYFSFVQTVFIISIVSSVLYFRFIVKYCQYKSMALLLMYPTVILSATFGTIRQGLAMAIFMGLVYGYYMEKKYIKFVIGVSVCSLLHAGCIILLLIYVPNVMKSDSFYNVLNIFCWSVGIGLSVPMLKSFLTRVLPYAVSYYIPSSNFSYAAIIIRLSMMAVIWYCYKIIKKYKPNLLWQKWYQFFMLGAATYGLFCFSGFIASRLMHLYYFAAILLVSNVLPGLSNRLTEVDKEILMINGYNSANGLERLKKRDSRQLFVIITMYLILIFFTHVRAFLSQGDYYDKGLFSYPYISVFNSEDRFKYGPMDEVCRTPITTEQLFEMD